LALVGVARAVIAVDALEIERLVVPDEGPYVVSPL
jgi:hypothetical protein